MDLSNKIQWLFSYLPGCLNPDCHKYKKIFVSSPTATKMKFKFHNYMHTVHSDVEMEHCSILKVINLHLTTNTEHTGTSCCP